MLSDHPLTTAGVGSTEGPAAGSTDTRRMAPQNGVNIATISRAASS